MTGGCGVLLPGFLPAGISTPGFKNGSVDALYPLAAWLTGTHLIPPLIPPAGPPVPMGLWGRASGAEGSSPGQAWEGAEELALAWRAAWPAGLIGRWWPVTGTLSSSSSWVRSFWCFIESKEQIGKVSLRCAILPDCNEQSWHTTNQILSAAQFQMKASKCLKCECWAVLCCSQS